MKQKKYLITSILLIAVLAFSFVLPGFICPNNLQERKIDADALGTVSYEEKVEQILGKFTEYDFDTADDLITFEGFIDLADYNLSGIEFLSTAAETTTKKYQARLDAQTEKFYLTVQYVQDDIVVCEETIETTPYYDADANDYFIVMPDGTTTSVYAALSTGGIEECLVVATAVGVLTAAEMAVVLAGVVVVAAPAITQVVTTVITTIVSWVRSFWSWFKSLWTPKTTTVEKTTVTQAISYVITVGAITVTAVEFDSARVYDPTKYYVAVADSADGLLYVTPMPVDTVSAFAILVKPTFVTGATKKSNGSFPQLVVSLYTPQRTDAEMIALEAGSIIGDPCVTEHIAQKTGYYNHFHPGNVKNDNNSHPHVFYGLPK